MTDAAAIEMDAAEIEAFLGTGGTGVLAFDTRRDDPPHAVPVSYGYDATEGTFYFRLSVGAESAKTAVVDRGVTFVTYERTEDGWRSVVASGHLDPIAEDESAGDALEGLRRVHIPLYDVFAAPSREVTFAFYRFLPDALTGRKESLTEA